MKHPPKTNGKNTRVSLRASQRTNQYPPPPNLHPPLCPPPLPPLTSLHHCVQSSDGRIVNLRQIEQRQHET